MNVSVIQKVGGVRIVGYKGGKSGGGGRKAVETPDSLHSISYAKVLDLISEGPIVGPVHGIANMLRDIYLDGTPIANANGSLNFQGVAVNFRAGTQTQSYIQGFPATEVTSGVDVELDSSQPWVRQVTNPTLSAVRVTLEVRGLSKVNPSNEEIGGYRIDYAIDVQAGTGIYREVVRGAFDGKTTDVYARSHRVELPEGASNWTIRVRRLTPNANSQMIQDRTFIQSVTEIIDAKLRMPMSAVVGIQVDASQFRAVPQRAYHFRGRIIRVPSNYDEETRQYFGPWDGAFKQAYTNNPAWIFYDMASNDRYGLGERLGPAALSQLKWALYPIAQYCDEMVPDGKGGTEPRFTCNCYLQQDGDAVRVMNDLASMFMGMVYEASGAVMVASDMPSSYSYTFSASNIEGGRVTSEGASRSTRYTVAQVTYNDMTDFGRAKLEVVEDEEGMQRYGVRITQIKPIGCTSRGQAQRYGRWALTTAKLQADVSSFVTGLEHAVVAPGRIIRVSDPHLAGRRIQGRIRAATPTVVTTDAEVGVRPGDRLIVNLPSGVSEERIVSNAVGQFLTMDNTEFSMDSTEITMDMVGLPGSTLTITVTQPFSELPEAESVWTVESESLTNRLYRVRAIRRREGLKAEILAVEHNPSKYDHIDFATRIEQPPITVVPPGIQDPPTDVVLVARSIVDQGIARHTATISWKRAKSAVAYQVQWRRDGSDWIDAGRTGSASIDIQDIRAGVYVARVRAINAADIPSVWEVSSETSLKGDLAPPPALVNLTATSQVFGILLRWGFPQGRFTAQRTEIWRSATNDLQTAEKLGDFAFPQSSHMLLGLAAGTRLYFWGRIVDLNGEYGAWFPASAGVMGESSWDASEYLEYFKGQIGRDELAQGLVEEIDGLRDGMDGFQALVDQERTERIAEDEALAQEVTTVKATADGAAAGVQQTSTALVSLDGKLQATWTVQAQVAQDGKVYAAGMTLGAYTDEGGQVQTSVYFLADRFAFLSLANGEISTPFVVQNGQTFLNQAFIGTAWIKSAQIESLDAGKIVVGVMSADRISTNTLVAKLASITTAYITTAHIGVAQVDTLRLASGAVVAGSHSVINTSWGSSGSTLVTIATGSIYLPYGGAVTAFFQYAQSGGSYPSGRNTIVTIDGEIVPNAVTNTADGAAMFTWISKAFSSGKTVAWSIQVRRPVDGTSSMSGRAALLAFQR
ncbi:tail fiber protein [Bordetella phage vB_BbrS_PHB09]|nr:tail fiber protein [Bordetella phage vB_BbrS_PHB09]